MGQKIYIHETVNLIILKYHIKAKKNLGTLCWEGSNVENQVRNMSWETRNCWKIKQNEKYKNYYKILKLLKYLP